MLTLLPSSWIKVILVILLVLLAAGSLFYNQLLIDEIMERERAGVELWGKALEYTSDMIHEELSAELLSTARVLRTIPEVPDSLIRSIEYVEAMQPAQQFVTDNLVVNPPFTSPIILVDTSGFITTHRFIDEKDLYPGIVDDFAAVTDPVVITFGVGDQQRQQFIYFGESRTVQYLRYFPFFQFGFLALLIGVGYMTYRSISRSERSNLWVGMAKEAAHQLGTPLSSMYGWIQLLKEQNREDEEALSIAYEIENDIGRIRSVAERFNKIGSEPELKKMRIEPILQHTIDYMERRLPRFNKSVRVEKDIDTRSKIDVNPELFQWAIENIFKNSMDAVKELDREAVISVRVSDQGNQLFIDIEDNGAGIDRNKLNEIFKTGYSTKKRGWGLGLSLTKRIIEEYHKGKIFVLRSEVNQGTVIRICLPVQSSL
ncbi:MAG: ATP-binding protein [Balneolaceae bacterium]